MRIVSLPYFIPCLCRNVECFFDAGYQFDDEKVSIVTQEKISTLDGGGESASAYILLYRQKRL